MLGSRHVGLSEGQRSEAGGSEVGGRSVGDVPDEGFAYSRLNAVCGGSNVSGSVGCLIKWVKNSVGLLFVLFRAFWLVIMDAFSLTHRPLSTYADPKKVIQHGGDVEIVFDTCTCTCTCTSRKTKNHNTRSNNNVSESIDRFRLPRFFSIREL